MTPVGSGMPKCSASSWRVVRRVKRPHMQAVYPADSQSHPDPGSTCWTRRPAWPRGRPVGAHTQPPRSRASGGWCNGARHSFLGDSNLTKNHVCVSRVPK
jgi:hypothetical protein